MAAGEEIFPAACFISTNVNLQDPAHSAEMPDGLVQMCIFYEQIENCGLYRE